MVAAVHQEEHPAGAAVLDQAVDRRDGGDRLAGTGGQLDQGPRPVALERVLPVGDGLDLIGVEAAGLHRRHGGDPPRSIRRAFPADGCGAGWRRSRGSWGLGRGRPSVRVRGSWGTTLGQEILSVRILGTGADFAHQLAIDQTGQPRARGPGLPSGWRGSPARWRRPPLVPRGQWEW